MFSCSADVFLFCAWHRFWKGSYSSSLTLPCTEVNDGGFSKRQTTCSLLNKQTNPTASSQVVLVPVAGCPFWSPWRECAWLLLIVPVGTLPQQPSPHCSVVFATLWMDVLTQLKCSCLHFAYLSSNSSLMQLYKYLSPAYVASNCRYSLCLQADTKHMPASAAAAWWALLGSTCAVKQSF